MIVPFLICMISVCAAAVAYFWPSAENEKGRVSLHNTILWTARIVLTAWVFLCFFPYPIVLPFAILLLFTGGALAFNRKRMLPIFAVISFLYVAAAVFFVGSNGVQSWIEVAKQVPKIELAPSLEHEYKQPITLKVTTEEFGTEADERLTSLERELDETENEHVRSVFHSYAIKSLQLAHASHVEQFVNSPGFGPNRFLGPMPYRAESHIEKLKEELPGPVPQREDSKPTYPPLKELREEPKASDQEAVSLGVATNTVTDSSKKKLHSLDNGQQLRTHIGAQLQFANPVYYGHVEPQKTAVGFFSHRFARELETNQFSYQVARIELVSLLKQKTPAVYVSEFLPNMEELAGNPTRPLTEFETTALAKLKQGEDIVVDDPQKPRFMLGSLRAAKQCLQCHNVERGVLLGAFRYQLK